MLYIYIHIMSYDQYYSYITTIAIYPILSYSYFIYDLNQPLNSSSETWSTSSSTFRPHLFEAKCDGFNDGWWWVGPVNLKKKKRVLYPFFRHALIKIGIFFKKNTTKIDRNRFTQTRLNHFESTNPPSVADFCPISEANFGWRELLQLEALQTTWETTLRKSLWLPVIRKLRKRLVCRFFSKKNAKNFFLQWNIRSCFFGTC